MKSNTRKYPYRRRLSIEIQEKLHNQLRMLAKKEGITITHLVRKIIAKEIIHKLFINPVAEE